MTLIDVSRAEAEAAMPGWVADDDILRDLWHGSLAWRVEMCAADGHADAEDRVRRLAHEHDLAKATITVAEAERRWGLKNLRQNGQGRLVMWKSDDERGTWLTTTYAMRRVFGPEVAELMAAADQETDFGRNDPGAEP